MTATHVMYFFGFLKQRSKSLNASFDLSGINLVDRIFLCFFVYISLVCNALLTEILLGDLIVWTLVAYRIT